MQHLAALEMALFLGLCFRHRRSLRQLPRLLVSQPYVTFAIVTLGLAGVAYSSFANLGVLTRQKSLIFPFLLLIPCLPEFRVHPKDSDADATSSGKSDLLDQNSSMSPSVSDQLESGGIPRSLTARHVKIGPPPGSGSDIDEIWEWPSRIT